MKITRPAPAREAIKAELLSAEIHSLRIAGSYSRQEKSRGFSIENRESQDRQSAVNGRRRELYLLYRGNLKLIVTCVWISTGEPSSK